MAFQFPSYFSLSLGSTYHCILGRTIDSNYTVVTRFLANLDSDALRLTSSAAIHHEYRAACKEMFIFRQHIRTFWRNLSRDLIIARGFQASMDMEDQFYDIVWFCDHITELARNKYWRILFQKANKVYIDSVRIIFYKHLISDAMSEILSYLT